MLTTPPLRPAPEATAGPPLAGRRFLAWLVDFGIVVAVGALLAVGTYDRISTLLSNVPALAGRSAWTLLSSHGDLVGGGLGAGMSLWHSAVLDVQEAFAGLVLFAFGYQFATLSWRGRTAGKALLDLRVGPAGPAALGWRSAAVRAAVSTVVDVGLYAVACCLLLRGSFVAAVLCWLLAVVVFWANVASALARPCRSLSDRAAGTEVTAGHVYQAAAQLAAQGGRIVLEQAQRAAESERTRQAQLVASGSARQLVELGRNTKQAGRAGVSRARQAYQQRRSPASAPLVQPPPYPQLPYAQPPYQQREAGPQPQQRSNPTPPGFGPPPPDW